MTGSRCSQARPDACSESKTGETEAVEGVVWLDDDEGNDDEEDAEG